MKLAKAIVSVSLHGGHLNQCIILSGQLNGTIGRGRDVIKRKGIDSDTRGKLAR